MAAYSFDDLPLARASTLVQQVHAELKSRILDGRLQPDEVVPDSVIAKQMGVSRAPVRDACNILVQSGLLTKQQNFPYRVRNFSTADLGELQLIRWGYESAAARHLVRINAAPEGATEAIGVMHDAYLARDSSASARADLQFHLAFVRATGLPELIRRYESVVEQLSLGMREIPAFVLSTQAHRHQELLTTLELSQASSNPKPLLLLLEAHLLTTRQDIERVERFEVPPEASAH